MRRGIDVIERSLFCCVMLNLFGALTPVVSNPDRAYGPQLSSARYIMLILTIILTVSIAAVFLLKKSSRGRAEKWNTVQMFLFYGYVIYVDISSVWALSYNNLLLYAALLNGVLLTLFFGSRLNGVRWVADTLWIAIVIALASSIIIILIFPRIGIHQTGDINASSAAGSWRGSFIHKSAFGEFAAISASFLVWYYDSVKMRWSKGGGVALSICVISVVFAHSATALMSLGCAWAYIALSRTLGTKAMFVLLPAVLLVGVAFFDDVELSSVLPFLGRDLTFTGRTDVWNYWLELANMKYIAGHGLLASLNPDVINASQTSLFQAATNPHSGFIELYFNGGMIGFVLFIGLILYTCVHALVRGAETLMGFLVCSLVIAFTDVNSFRLIDGTGIITLFICLFGMRMTRGGLDKKLSVTASEDKNLSQRDVPLFGRQRYREKWTC